jgi:hypothetical protein
LMLEAATIIEPNETKTFTTYIVPPAPGTYYVRVVFVFDDKWTTFDAGAVTVPE